MRDQFVPPEGATVEEALAYATPRLRLLRDVRGDTGRLMLELELREAFKDARGILETPEGWVGWRSDEVRVYAPAVVTSMLPDYARDLISPVSGIVLVNRLEALVKRLRTSGHLEPEMARQILDSCEIRRSIQFVAEPFIRASQRAQYEAERAPLQAPNAPKFNGRRI